MAQNLFISPDLNTISSGNIVSIKELDALRSLGNNVISIGHNDIDPTSLGLPNNPFLQDYIAMDYIANLNLKQLGLCHIYSTTFTNTIRYLKEKGAIVTNTIAAHDRNESIKEFENLGYQYPFDHIKNDKLWKIYSSSIRDTDIIITPSSSSEKFLKNEGFKQRIEIIPHGIDIPTKIENISHQFNIGYLGSIGTDKGLKYLIQAWSQLNYSDSTLIFAGRYSAELGHFINRFATKGKFHLMGWTDNIANFYNNISAYVQPSVTEGFGIEVLEAMSFKRPVICSQGAGASDCIENNVEGFIVPKRDPGAIADKIDWFKNHPIELKDMGERSREKSLDYDWTIIKNKYASLWKELSTA